MSAFSSLPQLYLASKSPRRRQLLENIGLNFNVLESEVEEAYPDPTNFRSLILSNALLKAEEASREGIDKSSVIIAADTMVVLSDRVLGKPADLPEAKDMLKRLSGNVQSVFTGFVLLSKKYGLRRSLVESKVYFRNLSEEEINSYIKTVEPYDKAGAYAVQGMGAIFIDKIEGSYTNVMGLPIETLLKEMESLTKISLFNWIPQRFS